MLKKPQSFCLVFATALAISSVLGCGGGGSSSTNAGPVINTNGGITTTTGNATIGKGSSSSPQQVQVKLQNGTTVNAIVPPGQPAFTTTSTLSIVPTGVPIINGLSPSFIRRGTNSGNPVNISYNKGASWVYTGVNLDPTGSLATNLALVAPVLSGISNNSQCYLEAVGPLTLRGNDAKLTIGQVIFGVVTDSNGVTALPQTLSLSLPSNGGLTTKDNFARVTYPTPDYATGTAILLFTWPGIVRAQTNPVSGGSVNYEGPSNSAPVRIPTGGVTTVEYLFSQP